MENLKTYIVITSIFYPTEAVRKFSQMEGYTLVVVGDKKTPSDWQCPNVIYLSVDDQNDMFPAFSGLLPLNHYCRKMIGYLYAIRNGADVIIDTDDDNIPLENWAFPSFDGTQDLVTYEGFCNVYQLYTKAKIWPRGLPLSLIAKQFDLERSITSAYRQVGVWQGLANEDPDVDAIYRLTSDQPCYFEERAPLVLAAGAISPFNSQNTAIRKELFPLLFLPTYVTFRFTDILRGLIAQPIMWKYGYHLGFISATVVQKRNPHDYFKDFLSEIPMYQYTESAVSLTQSAIEGQSNLCDDLMSTYRTLERHGIVEEAELKVVSAWLNEFV